MPSSHSGAQISGTDSATRRLVWAGQIAFIPTGILTTLLGPLLPILIARWALTDARAGDLFLVQFLASLAGVQLSALLLARVGFRPPFLLGLLTMALGIGTIWAGPVWLGFASVASYGLGVGLIIPTDNLLIAELSPDARAGALSLLNFFWGVGAVMCSLLMAWSDAHHLLPFFSMSVALSLVVLALAVQNLPFPQAIKSGASPIRWGEVWSTPTAWLFAAVFFLYPGAETAIGGWIGSYMTRLGPQAAATGVGSLVARILGSRQPGAIGSLMPAFFWSALTVGRGLGTPLLSRLPERRVLQAGFALGAIGLVLLLRSSSMAEVIASALITGLSFSTLYPITIARLSHHYGVAARSIGSVMFSLACIGPALLPWSVGIVSNATGSLGAGLIVPLGATVVLLLIHLGDW